MRHKKRAVAIIVILIIVTLMGCNSEKQKNTEKKIYSGNKIDLTSVFQSQFKKFNFLHYRKGNFTGTGSAEYIVFYEDQSRKYEEKFTDIHKIIIFTMMNRGKPKQFEINDESLAYNKWALKIITNQKLNFGTWDGYCRIADYNENGRDEVMFFGLAGLGFFVNIYEYHNDKMERVLESPPTYTLTISGVETVIEKNKKYIKVYGSGGGEKPGEIIPKGYRDWYLYSWNKEKEKYEIIDKGIEKWE